MDFFKRCPSLQRCKAAMGEINQGGPPQSRQKLKSGFEENLYQEILLRLRTRKLFDCRDGWLDFQSTKKYQLRFIGGKSRNRVKSRNPWFYYIPWFPPMYLDWSQNLPWHPNLSGLCTWKISIGKIPHLWDKNAPRTNLDPSKFLSRLWTRRVISPMAAAKRPFS